MYATLKNILLSLKSWITFIYTQGKLWHWYIDQLQTLKTNVKFYFDLVKI